MGQISSRKLTKKDLEFLMDKTKFEEKKIKKWHKGFIRDCPSGELSRNRFLEMYSNFFPRGDSGNYCSHVFRTFDKNKNGLIDFREFMLAVHVTSSRSADVKLTWAFEMYDVNGDGFIQPHEMTHIISAIYTMVGPHLTKDVISPEERTKEIFDTMDTNRDGKLSKMEFIEGCKHDKFLVQMLTKGSS